MGPGWEKRGVFFTKSFNFFPIFIILSFFLGSRISLGAEIPPTGSGGGYSYIDNQDTEDPDAPDFEFIDISGTGTATLDLSQDNNDKLLGPFPIGFTFNFFGENYTEFWISTNGFITFNPDSGPGAGGGEPIPSAGIPNNTITLLWTDLNPSGAPSDPAFGTGNIFYETQGEAPNRQLIVLYDGVPMNQAPFFPFPEGGGVRGEIVLLENTGETNSDVSGMKEQDGVEADDNEPVEEIKRLDIKIQLQDVTTTQCDSTVGIENKDGTQGLQYVSVEDEVIGLTRRAILISFLIPCGNGIVDPGEQCDDKNGCCTKTCQFEPIGKFCDDGKLNTRDDQCDGKGNCVGVHHCLFGPSGNDFGSGLGGGGCNGCHNALCNEEDAAAGGTGSSGCHLAGLNSAQVLLNGIFMAINLGALFLLRFTVSRKEKRR